MVALSPAAGSGGPSFQAGGGSDGGPAGAAVAFVQARSDGEMDFHFSLSVVGEIGLLLTLRWEGGEQVQWGSRVG